MRELRHSESTDGFSPLCAQPERGTVLIERALTRTVNAKAVEEEEKSGAKAVKRVSVKFRQSKKLRDLINSNVQLVCELTKKSNETSTDSTTPSGSNETGGLPTGGGNEPEP